MNVQVIRPEAILTTEYVAGEIIEKQRNVNTLVLHTDFTKWSLTNANIIIRGSSSWGTDDYYDRTSLTTTAWEADVDDFIITLDKTGKKEIILQVYTDYIQVLSKGVGDVSDSSLAIKAITGRS